MKRIGAAFFLVAFVLICSGTALASAASSSASPSSSPEPTPTPIVDFQLAPDSFDLVKEGDEGDVVALLQYRLADLGYFTFKVTGVFGSTTRDAVSAFQRENALTPDGAVGPETASVLFNNTAQRGYGPRGKPTPKPTPKPRTYTYGTTIEWSKANSLVAKRGGSKFRVQDFYTGKEYYMVRTGGTYHMDIEPATKKDNEIFKSTYGGRWSWDRRPVLAWFGGKWYAASINGMPHGTESEPQRIKNNGMNGQVCLHFKNSRTHASNAIDPAHQRCIRIAAGTR